MDVDDEKAESLTQVRGNEDGGFRDRLGYIKLLLEQRLTKSQNRITPIGIPYFVVKNHPALEELLISHYFDSRMLKARFPSAFISGMLKPRVVRK